MTRVVLLSLALFGCSGTTAFSHSFREREEPEFSRVLRDLERAPARQEQSVVVAVRSQPPGMIAWDLRAGRRMWAVAAQVTTTPVVAGRYVVTSEQGSVSVRKLQNGERAFAIGDSELRLVGADGEGDKLLISLARGAGDSPPGVLYGASGGALRWSQELTLPIAVPAIAGGVAVVPWAQQRLSFLAMSDGTERARLRLEDAVIGHAFRHGGTLLLGQHEIFPISEQVAERSRRGDAFLRPRGRPLPGQPPLMADGYERRMAPDSARNRIRLVWSLQDGEELAFRDGLVYFVFYRMVFALEAGEDRLRWVHVLPTDAVGADAGEGGVLVATTDGSLRFVSAGDGREIWNASLGGRIAAAEIRLGGFTPEGSAEGHAEPLRTQLEHAASLDDPRMDGGRAFAIRYLTRFSEEGITQQLIRLCSRNGVTGPARVAACNALAERTNGGNYVRDAMRERGSFLAERPPPPVGALARAAATMNMRTSLPELLRHLDDPATPVDELPGLFQGLSRLGDARTAGRIERFLRLYHADASDSRDIEALGAAATALLTLAPNRFAAVQEISGDEQAPQALRQRLTRALTDYQSAQTEEREEPAQPQRPEPAAPAEADNRPERTTNHVLQEVMGTVSDRLRRCLEPRGADPIPSARIMMIVNDQGEPATVRVNPPSMQECMEPHVRSRHFPRTRMRSESLTYTVRREASR